MASYWQQFNDGLAEASTEAGKSLVQVSNGRRGAGAGIIWDAGGLIITNAHVVRRSSPKVILQDGREFPARLLGYDKHKDLAALAIDASDLPAVTPGDSRSLRSGEVVIALGYPWGIIASATAGIVVTSGSGLPDMPGGRRELISLSLSLRPGYSGGPLLDSAGRVVGINVMMAGPEVGLAIPVHVVETFVAELMKEVRQAAPHGQETPSAV